jgi:neutral ceramidase
MARSHIAVALSAAVIVFLVFVQLLFNLGLPSVDFWHWTREPSYDGALQAHLGGGEQSGELLDDPSSYLVGVGKADITG